MKEREGEEFLRMSTAKQGTTLILASVAVCLLIYVMKQKMDGPGPSEESAVAAAVGAVRRALGSSGGRPRADCSKISPNHADWAWCAQGSAMGRVPTKHPSAVLSNTSLDFASDSLQNQGLGTGRLQDGFVHDQFSSDNHLGASTARLQDGFVHDQFSSDNSLGVRGLGGTRLSSIAGSVISSSAAAAFPFASTSTPRSDGEKKTLKQTAEKSVSFLSDRKRSQEPDEQEDAVTNVKNSVRSLRSLSDRNRSQEPDEQEDAVTNVENSVRSLRSLSDRNRSQEPDEQEDAVTNVENSVRSLSQASKKAAGGMNLKRFLTQGRRTKARGRGRGRGIRGFAARSQVSRKLGVAPFEESGAEFNPFSGDVGASSDGLMLSEAYEEPSALGMGSTLAEAFGGGGRGGGGGFSESLGAAVSPFSSSASVGVSPVEISAATAALDDVNIVQSTGGGHIDRFIRP